MATTPLERRDLATADLTPGFDPDDLFRYGWRWVVRTLPGGHLREYQEPLTLEDVLHPQEGDFIVQNADHERLCRYLADVCDAQLADDPSAVVLHDVRVAWDEAGKHAHGPDVAVFFGVRERKRWPTFNVAIEGARPALIIEVTSPETANVDRADKVDEYAEVGVPLYVIVDTYYFRKKLLQRLIGYQLTREGYQPLFPDERGWLWLEPVRVWLAITDGKVVCYDEQGQPFGDHATEVALRRAAEARAQAEVEARVQAEGRAAEAEARIRALEEQLRRQSTE
jgi:colicin import membrane protein